jgi:DNA-binding response OmpR family regulator
MSAILIIEDNADLAYGLQSNLALEGHNVSVAEDGAQAMQHINRCSPELVILDLMLPDTEGFSLLKPIREAIPNALVLILSARGQEIDKVRGLKLGADDYLTKPFGLMELLARVEALLRRTQQNSEHSTSGDKSIVFGQVQVNPLSRYVCRNQQTVELAPKEFDLLLALLRSAGKVQSRLELLQTVWGHQAKVETRTVDTHIGELRKKLEDDPTNPQFIMTRWTF